MNWPKCISIWTQDHHCCLAGSWFFCLGCHNQFLHTRIAWQILCLLCLVQNTETEMLKWSSPNCLIWLIMSTSKTVVRDYETGKFQYLLPRDDIWAKQGFAFPNNIQLKFFAVHLWPWWVRIGSLQNDLHQCWQIVCPLYHASLDIVMLLLLVFLLFTVSNKQLRTADNWELWPWRDFFWSLWAWNENGSCSRSKIFVSPFGPFQCDNNFSSSAGKGIEGSLGSCWLVLWGGWETDLVLPWLIPKTMTCQHTELQWLWTHFVLKILILPQHADHRFSSTFGCNKWLAEPS